MNSCTDPVSISQFVPFPVHTYFEVCWKALNGPALNPEEIHGLFSAHYVRALVTKDCDLTVSWGIENP